MKIHKRYISSYFKLVFGNKKNWIWALTTVSIKMDVFWVVLPYSLADVYRRFRVPGCLHHQRNAGRSNVLWKAGKLLPVFTVLQSRRQPPSKIKLSVSLNRMPRRCIGSGGKAPRILTSVSHTENHSWVKYLKNLLFYKPCSRMRKAEQQTSNDKKYSCEIISLSAHPPGKWHNAIHFVVVEQWNRPISLTQEWRKMRISIFTVKINN
jgi:hypothetical protein